MCARNGECLRRDFRFVGELELPLLTVPAPNLLRDQGTSQEVPDRQSTPRVAQFPPDYHA
jgi:hypothetical protein